MQGTRKTALIVILAALACVPAAAAAAPIPQQPGQAPAPTGKEPYRETERGPAYSLIEIALAGPGFRSMLSLVKAVYDIAKERGFAYAFATAPATNAAPPPGGAPGVVVIKVFMTKDRQMPLRALMGADYSQQAQDQFDRDGWMSVRQFERMFEADPRQRSVSGPDWCLLVDGRGRPGVSRLEDGAGLLRGESWTGRLGETGPARRDDQR